jgi:hypothetical protein
MCRGLRNRLAVLLVLLALPEVGAARQPSKLVVAGESSLNGIFDPSVEYAPGDPWGWLSYSAVYGDVRPWGPHVETRVARSADGGAHWSFVGVVNASTPTRLVRRDGSLLDGVWNYEVSSLVHDPGDAGREWKLFAHRIFRKTENDFTDEQNLPAYSWIVLRSAPDPAGPWGPEVALLSSGPLPPAPYDDVQVAVNGLDPSLASLLVYSEPGAFHRDGVLYLSLTGLTETGPDRIVLLASDDHGAGWRYVGTPLSGADAAPLGFLGFDGSAIAEQAGRVFLLVTPESPGVLHDGTLLLEFDDLAAGSLMRADGVPVVRGHVPPQPGLPAERRGGQADYHERNRAGGLLQPSLELGDFPEIFQIYATGESLTPAAPVPALSPGGRAGAALLLLGAAAAAAKQRNRPRRVAPAPAVGS